MTENAEEMRIKVMARRSFKQKQQQQQQMQEQEQDQEQEREQIGQTPQSQRQIIEIEESMEHGQGLEEFDLSQPTTPVTTTPIAASTLITPGSQLEDFVPPKQTFIPETPPTKTRAMLGRSPPLIRLVQNRILILLLLLNLLEVLLQDQ